MVKIKNQTVEETIQMEDDKRDQARDDIIQTVEKSHTEPHFNPLKAIIVLKMPAFPNAISHLLGSPLSCMERSCFTTA